MSQWVEIKAKTVDEALTEALIQLETSSDMIEYEVVEQEKGGLFGLFSKPAVIKVRKKDLNASGDKKKADKESKKDSFHKVEHKVVENKKVEKSESKNVEKPEVKKPEINVDVVKIAEDFLTKVFKAMDIETKILINFVAEDSLLDINLEGDDMGILIGKRGQTLDSLQYLTSLAVNKECNTYLKVKLDTENYRARRKETLENLAKNISYKVKRTKHAVSLEPMNPYERRIIHSVLQNDRYVETHSEGEEPFRRVVVTLKKGYSDYKSSGKYNNRGRRNYNNRNNRYQSTEAKSTNSVTSEDE